MESGDNFAFMLPIMMGTFGIVFLLLSRLTLRLPSSFAWGVAFASGACAFSVTFLPLGPDWQGFIADILFFVSFYAYGEGLLVRFGRPRLTLPRVGFVALCLLVDIYFIFGLRSLEAELLLVDIALTILLAVPVAMVFTAPRNLVDRALVVVAGLVALDTFVRVIMFNVVIGMSNELADFTTSQYAFFMQVSGGLLGMCFALSALGSVMMDILARYREAAEHDPLTGLCNRRGFEEALLRRGHAAGGKGTLLVCDVDHFKQVNDVHGHGTGDAVLVELSRQFVEALPPDALAARFGGEEFIAYIPRLSLAEVEAIAFAGRARVEATDWLALGVSQAVTISIGVAQHLPEDRTVHDAIARADRSLYVAKSRGRNQVVSEPPLSMTPAQQPQALARLHRA